MELPPYKGSVLRGGFGSAFRRVSCALRASDCRPCSLREVCPYGYVFETSPPAESEVLSNLKDIPRPFVIEPPEDDRTEYLPGEELTLGLVLAGRSVAYLPYFVAAFRNLGRTGIGRTRAGFDLVRVSQLSAAEWAVGLAKGAADYSRGAPVFDAGRGETVSLAGVEERCVGYVHVARAAETVSRRRVTLEFLTMARLKHGDALRPSPTFHILARALLRRVSSLAYFHHGVKLDLDYPALVERARQVRLVGDETRWVDWARYSNRQDRAMDLGGLLGRATYEGDLGEFRELLVVGSLVHVGKNTTFGLGRYRLYGGSE
jgi:hypothetical protein